MTEDQLAKILLLGGCDYCKYYLYEEYTIAPDCILINKKCLIDKDLTKEYCDRLEIRLFYLKI